MKFNLSNFTFNRETAPIWLTGLIGIGLIVVLLTVWLTKTGSIVESAMTAYRAGNVQQAFDLFAEARDRHQINTAEEWNLFGNVYRDSKHPLEAIEAYKTAIRIDSGYETAYRNLSYAAVDLAEQEKNPQRLQEAIGLIEKGHKAHPKSVTMVEDLIMLYAKIGNTAKVAELTAIRTELLK